MSHLVKLRQRVGSDGGFTLVEASVAALLGAILLVVVGGFLANSMTAGAFTEGQSATLNDVRNMMQRIEKEIRGADSITWCAPAGSCMEVGAQTVSGGFITLRYTHVGNELRREEYDGATSTWSDPLTVIERVANTATQKVFACDTQSALLRVNIDLYIRPTPSSGPNLNIQTSVRPRNFASVATCP